MVATTISASSVMRLDVDSMGVDDSRRALLAVLVW